MSQEQKQLRFSVEESVWFQKGQEVSELLSISLDPDISIHEHDQYISIRGALQLTGEYVIDREAKQDEEQYVYANVRYVNEVQTSEDGVSILAHRFPVDITIPRNRIDNLEEVYVSIETFDYELPDEKSLKLVADLSISGILNEQIEQQEEEVEAEEEVVNVEPIQRVESKESEEQADDIENEQILSQANQPFSQFFEEPELNSKETADATLQSDIQEEAKEVEEVILEPRIENQNEPEEQILEDNKIEADFELIRAVEPEPEQNEAESVEIEVKAEEIEETVEASEQSESDELYESAVIEVRKEAEKEVEQPKEVQYTFFSKSEPTNVQQDTEEDDDDRDEDNTKDAHYLTSLFARDDEEDFSRVKMCIVQQGDTIEQICERYDITVQQLLRVNNFHADQDVYEGQILYIPDYSVSKS
ncbi:stage VI sporulation protein D [Metabacillus malikii]|uniref:Stage VI sporulation protein D n=1 Tax=Metabacillus malikii TaxID=1504265 RepID=A0ABT9ZLM7_9BACI|nr:stage VI sporulation protein D [Metabacillus malikii]MDQ0232804.1 stage VI sporulation protein D [Metabacillus malikii]